MRPFSVVVAYLVVAYLFVVAALSAACIFDREGFCDFLLWHWHWQLAVLST
jgi:hypothetical protein